MQRTYMTTQYYIEVISINWKFGRNVQIPWKKYNLSKQTKEGRKSG